MDPENIARLSRRISEIRIKCGLDVAALYNGYHWDIKKDLRLTSLNRLTRLMVGLDVAFVYFSQSDPEKVIEGIRSQFDKNIAVEQFLNMYERFILTGFVSSLFFIVDRVLRTYLRYLDQEYYKESMACITVCKKLLEKLDRDIVGYDHSVFNLLRLIRNSLHSNAVHFPNNKYDHEVTLIYRGKELEFLYGKRITFVTWDLILDITDDIRGLLFFLSNNITFRSITGPIPDDFALERIL